MDIQPYIRKAQYHETDAMGIIHHANYIRWFEEARVDFLEQLGYGYERATQSGVDFAVVGVTCNYSSMVRFGETVSILCTIPEVTPSRMSVRYQVTDNVTGQLRATGESRHCYFDGGLGRPVSLKKTLPELYELLLAQVNSGEGNHE